MWMAPGRLPKISSHFARKLYYKEKRRLMTDIASNYENALNLFVLAVFFRVLRLLCYCLFAGYTLIIAFSQNTGLIKI